MTRDGSQRKFSPDENRPCQDLVWDFESVACCPVCGENTSTVVLDRAVRSVPLRFVRCSACAAVYQNPRPSRDTLARYFSSTAFIKDERDQVDLNDTLGYYNYFAWDPTYRKTARLRLRRIRRFVPPPGRMLEIGTATGSFLAEAQAAGYEVRGLDLSTRLADFARARYNLTIDNGFIEEFALPQGAYDIVCYFGGIACSHDPVRALSNIRRALKPGGIFVFNASPVDSLVGVLKKDGFPEFNHASLVLYTRSSLAALLRRTGFDVLQSGLEWQFASLERVVTYWRSNALWRLVRSLRLENTVLPVLAFGTRFYVCRAEKP